VPAPKLLASAADIARLMAHAPSVIWDLTSIGLARSHEYAAIWPHVVTYAYPQNAAAEPQVVLLPCRLSDAPDWGARVAASHGVLAAARMRERTEPGTADTPFASTIDLVADQHQLGQISLLVLPACTTALAPLLGASRLLAAANIMAIAILDQSGLETPPDLLDEVAGILRKFGYRWALIDGVAVSVAIHDRAEGILLARGSKSPRRPWLEAAQCLQIALKGMIHVGDSEAAEVQLYLKKGLTPLFIVGPNAQREQRQRARAPDATAVIYVDTEDDAVTTLDALAASHDFRQCNLLHLQISALGSTGIAGAANTLRQIDLVEVELKRATTGVDGVTVSELDTRLRKYGFLRTSIHSSVYPDRDDAVYVRAQLLWERDPLQAAAIALQQADVSIKTIGVIGGDPHGIPPESVTGGGHERLVDIALPGSRPVRSVTRIVPLGRQPPPEDFGYKVEFAYLLQHQDSVEPQASPCDALAADIDVLVLTDGSAEAFRKAVESTGNSMRLSAIVVLGALGDRSLAAAVSNAFDLGFLMERSTAALSGRIFIRSELIREPARWLSCNNQFGDRHFYFSSLGNIGRFGNQLFQLWHLILSGLRYGATVSSRKWNCEQYYGLEFLAKQGVGDILHIQSYDWRVMGLWAQESLPPNIDFYGHFQWIPPLLHRHRVFLSRVFDLQPEWAEEMSKVIHALRSSRRPLTVFHVRRTDYINHVNPLMRLIPGEWYGAALQRLRDSTIYVASDDLEAVRAELPDFTLLSFKDFADSRLPPLLIDHCVMRAADTLLVINSTYSRSAAMLGKDGQAVLLASIHDKAFQPYAPWSDPIFWFRFQYDDPEEFARASMEVERWLTSAGLTG
jgi:hypothetical protein